MLISLIKLILISENVHKLLQCTTEGTLFAKYSKWRMEPSEAVPS
jgi:hypothetical protein